MSTRYSLSAFQKLAGSPGTYQLPERIQRQIESVIPTFDQINPSAAFLFVFDFTKMEYLFVSESAKEVTGYSAQQWQDGGIDWVVSILHPKDSKRLTKLHAALFEIYYSLPLSQRKNCRYVYEYHLVREDGVPIWLLQQGTFIEISDEGKPIITFDILTDVTQFKRGTMMTLTMSVENVIIKTMYFSEEDTIKFSKRELEILKLISLGFTSKDIGEKLFISSHTVDTHRRHMLRKTGRRDSTALVFYARDNGLV